MEKRDDFQEYTPPTPDELEAEERYYDWLESRHEQDATPAVDDDTDDDDMGYCGPTYNGQCW